MRNDLPNETAPNFSARIRETLMTYLGKSGDPLDRGITLRDLVESGLVSIANLRAASRGATLPLGVGDEVQPAHVDDLTPPPTPDGFAATAGVTTVTVQHNTPIYTQGHGHLRTRVYGATRAAGAPNPTFSSATEIGQFTGLVFAFSSNPATEWHLWAKWESNDGILSPSPAGGTNGIVVTTGQDVSTLLTALSSELDANGNPVNPNTLLITRATPTTINGVSVPAGVYMKDTYIQNGTISNAKIASAAIDNAKIASLDAAKITSGYIDAARINAGSIDAKIANLSAAVITSGTLDTARIGSASISLAKIDKSTIGSLSALSATLGTVTAGSITSSDLTVGSNPAISGTSMSGSGTRVYSDGRFAIGNNSSNIIFDGSKAYLNGFTAQLTTVSSGGYGEYWPSNTSSYTRTSSEVAFTGFDTGRPLVFHLTGQLGLWCYSVGNSLVPERVDAQITLEWAYSTNSGASYSSFSSVGRINMYALADHLTTVTASNRNFYNSGAWSGTVDLWSSITNIKFRIVRFYRAYTSATTTAAAYFGGPISPTAPLNQYTQVDAYFDNATALIYQIKV